MLTLTARLPLDLEPCGRREGEERDEAYLDLTEQVDEWEEGVALARRLQQRVRDEVGLSASLGVAANRLVATDVVRPR